MEYFKNYKIIWLGWNHHNNHDKIWGMLELKDGRYYSFWGKRKKNSSF